MRKPRLMTPGPAPVPEDVLLELARPVIHHRSAEAKQVIIEVTAGLKDVFRTRNDVLILTASGTGHPVEAIGKVVAKTSAVFAVDGISGVGAMECRTDEWGIDLLCVGSQKALMIPPGLAFVAVSPKAWDRIDRFDSHSYYFNLKAARKKMK